MADDTNAREALKELVELKALKDRLLGWEAGCTDELAKMSEEYARRKPLAWAAARAVLATPADRGAPAEGAVLDEARERELFEEAHKAAGYGKIVWNTDRDRPVCSRDHDRYVGWQIAREQLSAPTSQAGRDALDARKPFTPTQLRRLYDNSPAECTGLTRAAFERVARLVEGAHCIDAALASLAQAGQGEQA